MKFRTVKSFVFLLVVISTFALLFTGCETKVNEDYSEIDDRDYHDFTPYTRHSEYMANTGYNFNACTECHGENLDGHATGTAGSSERSCYRCHNSDNHFSLFGKPWEHSSALRASNWDLNTCYNCHSHPSGATGLDFGGSCNSTACHNQANGGPHACNVCHGDFSAGLGNPAFWAPPGDLEGNFATTNPGVGAHRTHLSAPSGWFDPVSCDECHTVPSAWNESGHIDVAGSGAEIVFANPDMVYDSANNSCSAVYCHGDGNVPVWTEVDGSWNSCGSCHALPPADPHPQNDNCSLCHSQVIDADGNFINPSLHGNGRPD